MLGDQKTGTNIEAPESELRRIIADEFNSRSFGGDINIKFTGSLAQLARILKPEIERDSNNRLGTNSIKKPNFIDGEIRDLQSALGLI